MKSSRSNSDWLKDLGTPGPAREAALQDLRALLLEGLPYALSSWLATSGPDLEDSLEDFAQEALLRILDHLGDFRGASQFTTWAHKIAVRVALTELRRKRWADVSLDELLAQAGDAVMVSESGRDPETAAEQADLLALVERLLIEELTPRQHRAMMAAMVHGMPIEEVGRRMNMKRNAVYKLLHDARRKLKARLAREGLTPAEILAVFEAG